MNFEAQKKAAAVAALGYIEDGMKVGLGTGSTASHFIGALEERHKACTQAIRKVLSQKPDGAGQLTSATD